MNAIRIYDPNNGYFKKGMTPWNKGTNKGGRKNCSEKGKCGFQPREVVAIGEDGNIIRRYPSVEKAKEALNVRDRHTIIRACKQKNLCRGLRLMYVEDYIPWADYHYKRSKNRDIYGRLQPGHHENARHKPSEAALASKKRKARELSLKMAADPNNKWGKGNKAMPIYCVETKETFKSQTEAALHFGINSSQISAAITNHRRCHGYTFRKINK